MTDSPTDKAFAARLDQAAADTESLLDSLLGIAALEGEIARPKRLVDAMRHGSLNGGKRLRPFLVLESAALFDVARSQALMAGAALECIHCYSLVHDDMPPMDNDDMRRGRPTVHKAYDDATAILVGDSLLTLAFDILARPETHPDPALRIALVSALARASGVGGMAGGQMLDLAAEGRFGKVQHGETEVFQLQAMKTGALLHFGCIAGAILGKATPAQHDALSRYGKALGTAFQIADDLLDLEGDAATMGKAVGKDAAAGKATFISILGPDGARRKLKELVNEADSALSTFGPRAEVLRQTARFVAERRN